MNLTLDGHFFQQVFTHPWSVFSHPHPPSAFCFFYLMACNLIAMASNQIAMVSNLLYIDLYSDGLRPNSNGLQPNSHGKTQRQFSAWSPRFPGSQGLVAMASLPFTSARSHCAWGAPRDGPRVVRGQSGLCGWDTVTCQGINERMKGGEEWGWNSIGALASDSNDLEYGKTSRRGGCREYGPVKSILKRYPQSQYSLLTSAPLPWVHS